MRRLIKHSKYLLLAIASVAFAGCKGLLDHNDNVECDYSIRLRYHYNQENRSRDNKFSAYIHTLDQYIFDEDETLVWVGQVTRDICDGTWHSDVDLPPGRYSVIAVGNRDTRSDITDGYGAGCCAPTPGVTKRDDMRMTLENAVSHPDQMTGPSEPLYHGYRTFSVSPTQTSNVRVDMVHSHLRLRLKVRWKNNVPQERVDYYLTLGSVPSHYALMPEYYYPEGTTACQTHAPASSDPYRITCNNVIHHIPYTCHAGEKHTTYRHDTYINNDNELWGEFTAYRLQNDLPVKLDIWHWDAGTQTASKVLTNGIDLQDYLVNFRGINLDHTLKQHYELEIVIDGDRAEVMPLSSKVDDWEEGGTIS